MDYTEQLNQLIEQQQVVIDQQIEMITYIDHLEKYIVVLIMFIGFILLNRFLSGGDKNIL